MKDGATADEASRAKSKEENDPLELMCIHDRYACRSVMATLDV